MSTGPNRGASEPTPGGTSPPLEASDSADRWVVRRANEVITPLVQRLGRGYLGGQDLGDAMAVAERLDRAGQPTTIGYWDSGSESIRDIGNEYLAAVSAIAASGLDCYLSAKPPALGFDQALTREIGALARRFHLRVHLDSHGADAVDPSCAMVDFLLEALPPELVSTTLPGRWARSLSDADFAVSRAIAVRVVKGQWPDPGDPERDMSAGFLEVVDRLAGRASHVAVATHDVDLAVEAIRRLRAAGTSHGVEVLLGAPSRPLTTWAVEHGVAVRTYVPYGPGYVPHALRYLRHHPGITVRMARDLIAVALAAVPRPSKLGQSRRGDR